MNYKNAYTFGKMNEARLKPILEKYFNTTLEMPSYRYCKYDYYDEKIEIELKSRKIMSDRYNTYHLGKGKIDYAQTSNKKFFIVLNFTDKIMVCDYNKNKEEIDNLEGKEIHLVRGGTCVNIEIPRQLFCEVIV